MSSTTVAPSGSNTGSSQNTNTGSFVSIPLTAAAGGLTFTQPPQTSDISFYKVASGAPITFGWNFTDLLVTPTHLTLSAVCDNGNTYPVGLANGVIPGRRPRSCGTSFRTNRHIPAYRLRWRRTPCWYGTTVALRMQHIALLGSWINMRHSGMEPVALVETTVHPWPKPIPGRRRRSVGKLPVLMSRGKACIPKLVRSSKTMLVTR